MFVKEVHKMGNVQAEISRLSFCAKQLETILAFIINTNIVNCLVEIIGVHKNLKMVRSTKQEKTHEGLIKI